MIGAEAIFVALALTPRFTQLAAIGSLVFLSAALVYHLNAAAQIPWAGCGCLGRIQASHVEMIPLTVVGLVLAATALWASRDAQRAQRGPVA